jgi:hypothetical protein
MVVDVRHGAMEPCNHFQRARIRSFDPCPGEHPADVILFHPLIVRRRLMRGQEI